MTGFGFFQPAIAAMSAQSQALAVIGGNISNMATDGYKRTDINFETMVSQTWASAPADVAAQSRQSDLGGVGANTYARISEGGELGITGGDLDAAIDGPGLFVLADATGSPVYSRGGHFQATLGTAAPGSAATVSYLADADGHTLQGWPIAADGSHSADAGALVPVRVDPEAAGVSGRATSSVQLGLNLPANAAAGPVEGYDVGVYDATGRLHSIRLDFGRQPTANTWTLAVSAADGETITIDPPATSGAPVGNSADGAALSFATDGTLGGPGLYTVSVTYADGTTSQFALDLGAATQFAGPFTVQSADQDGLPPGRLSDVSIDAQGQVVGQFDNGQTKPLYKLPLADFPNSDGLEALDGNIYRQSAQSGAAVLAGSGEAGLGRVQPGAVERSNVKLEAEFTRMMVTQNAYNSAATAFRTLDEMAELTRDIKR